MLRRTLALLGAIALTFAAAACDDAKADDRGDASDSTSAPDDRADFDSDLDAIDAGAGGDEVGASADPAAAKVYCDRKEAQAPGATLETDLANWEALQGVAPAEIRDDIGIVVAGHRDAVAEGDPDAEVDDEAEGYTSALQNIRSFDAGNCSA